MSLRIHTLQGELSTEKSLNGALRQSQQRFFDSLLRLKEQGEINDNILNCLMDRGGVCMSNI